MAQKCRFSSRNSESAAGIKACNVSMQPPVSLSHRSESSVPHGFRRRWRTSVLVLFGTILAFVGIHDTLPRRS